MPHEPDSSTGSMNDYKRALISVVIPTLNAGDGIVHLLDALQAQRRKPDEILVVDSSSDDGTGEKVTQYRGIELLTIPREEFNHGATRDKALRHTHGDFVLFLTQDALPEDDQYIDSMVQAFADPAVAMVSGRQIARDDARPFERLVREYNYPAKSYTRSREDIPRMGIKAYFASDVCSAYRRSAYLQVGGFERVSTNEDMFIAAAFLHNDWKIAYCAEARVKHSHNFTLRQQYRRNFASAVEMELHKDSLRSANTTAEGARLMRSVVSQLWDSRQYGESMAFVVDCCARILGNKMGTAKGRRLADEA
ncbi:glycosyl transferase family 2 [Bifidobacterium apri]|uniref:Glycosyl transferase family 2 n=1 Tax=Bifidobacterium apri TaxID=1769423 RepID=A0A6A2VEQ0_9BIFI|nr:glycosyl transferase family 2 [Bifidobacterium apri]